MPGSAAGLAEHKVQLAAFHERNQLVHRTFIILSRETTQRQHSIKKLPGKNTKKLFRFC
jgi:hypothetical protein